MSSYLSPGDIVVCRVREDKIVSAYSDFDGLKEFQILAEDGLEYVVHVKQYDLVKDCYILDPSKAKKLKILNQFIGENVFNITRNYIYKIKEKIDGMNCNRCKDFCSQAQSNCEDGSFTCYSCRQNPYR
jgi:hypothetical protein